MNSLLFVLFQHAVGVEHGSVLHFFHVGSRLRSLKRNNIKWAGFNEDEQPNTRKRAGPTNTGVNFIRMR